MPLRLSDAEIAAIERANTVLLAPFAYESGEAWRRAAARAVEDCLGGNASSFALPISGEPLLAAAPDVMRSLQAVDPPPDWVVHGLTVRRRERGLTVTNWDELYDANQVRSTDFYNEVVRPQRLLAPVVMVRDTGISPIPAALSVYFGSEKSADRNLNHRKEMLHLLYPAFCSGLKTYIGFHKNSLALRALTEHAAVGVLFFDGGGRLGHENEFFRRLMECDPDKDAVRAEVTHMVRNVLALPFADTTVPNSMFQTRCASYRISATVLDNYDSPTAIRVLALVERIARQALDARSLAKQYDLTRREIEIAQLLRQGLATREMAIVLGISVNTVRRHVEQILLKLNVHTRTAAVARLTGTVS
ncbi:MAG: response regulator transcription factor [Gemmatimonadaceae bacterium]